MKTNGSSPRNTSFSKIALPDNLNVDQVAGSHLRTEAPVVIPDGLGNQSSEITQRQSTRHHQVQRSENGVSKSGTKSTEENLVAPAVANAPCFSSRNVSIQEEGSKEIIVTGAFPPSHLEPGVLVETIRDLENPGRMAFLHWENGSTTILHSIEHDGRTFVPPDTTSSFYPELSLPNGLQPCGDAVGLLTKIVSAISQFVKLQPEPLAIVALFVLASWFSDCFEAAPYLWVVGPLGSGKSTLLKLLSRLCRRGLIAGDLRSGSLYKLVDDLDPTLVIDELELGSSGANAEILRLLRTGSTPGIPAFRNGRRFSTYCFKVISSRQPINDAALSSRGLIISMLPTKGDTLPLDEAALQRLEKEFQPKLCYFRLQNYAAVKNLSTSPMTFEGLSPRMRQIARALTAPFLGREELTTEMLPIFRIYDDEARIERALEPEWLVAEFLLGYCHDELKSESHIKFILVGGVAVQVNKNLESRHEEFRLSAKKAGLVLKSLGLRTSRVGNRGRGLPLTDGTKRKIHEIAAQLGIDRRAIAPLAALDAGQGGAPCALCEEFKLTGGLHFV